jgi:hypothetical protein
MPLNKLLLILLLTTPLFLVSANLCAQNDQTELEEPAPPEAPPPQPQAEPILPNGLSGMKASNIRLEGIIILGDDRKAMIRLKVPKVDLERKKWESPFRTVREGQDIEGFRVVKIEPKSISVEKDGKTYEIHLFAGNEEIGR